MKHSIAILVILCLIFVASPARAQTETDGLEMDIVHRPWVGDLDGMIRRRLIRVLVAYNKTVYFLDKDTQRGIAYDAMKAFESDLNKKWKLGKLGVHVVFIPVSRDELLSGLVDGRGDVSIASLTITPERLKIVDFTEPTFRNGSEIVVTGPGAPPLATLDDLAGQEVFIRRSSSFHESLAALNERLEGDGKKPVLVDPAPEQLETEDILEMVNAGLVGITIADRPTAELWKQVFPDIVLHPDLAVRTGADFAWAIRKDSPGWKAELNAFIRTHRKGTTFGNITFRKYLQSIQYVKNATADAEMEKFQLVVELFRKYGDRYRLDWLLMVAQGYQESRLDQEAKSRVGAPVTFAPRAGRRSGRTAPSDTTAVRPRNPANERLDGRQT